jgi:peptidoglycan/xylan/chitin deacetylase (PgdA/CDA1 family)
MIVAIIAFVLIVFVFASLRYSLFSSQVDGIPVLMYHKVSRTDRDFLTVTADDFERQLNWLNEQGYQSISMQTFQAFLQKKVTRESLPIKPCLLTFDDGYENNVSNALPILKKCGWTACLFVTSSYIETAENDVTSQYLNLSKLRTWLDAGMELALHSHEHPNYRQLSIEAVVADLKVNRKFFERHGLKVIEALAYPFGARPKEALAFLNLKNELKKAGVELAFRIGNRIHSWKELEQKIDHLDVCRIDIRGDDPFFEFKIKVLKGRSKRL